MVNKLPPLSGPVDASGEPRKPEHVCGLQGFGRIGDICRGCEFDAAQRTAAPVPSPPAQEPPSRTTLICAAHMLDACAENMEKLCVGYGAEQMRGIAERLREGTPTLEQALKALPPSSPVADSPMANLRGSLPAEESDAEFDRAIAEIREPVADSPTQQVAVEMFQHVQRGHILMTRENYVECDCGATFWFKLAPSASAGANLKKETTEI